jgi:hypothetical protein
MYFARDGWPHGSIRMLCVVVIPRKILGRRVGRCHWILGRGLGNMAGFVHSARNMFNTVRGSRRFADNVPFP